MSKMAEFCLPTWSKSDNAILKCQIFMPWNVISDLEVPSFLSYSFIVLPMVTRGCLLVFTIFGMVIFVNEKNAKTWYLSLIILLVCTCLVVLQFSVLCELLLNTFFAYFDWTNSIVIYSYIRYCYVNSRQKLHRTRKQVQPLLYWFLLLILITFAGSYVQ